MVSFVNRSIYENETEYTFYSEYDDEVIIPSLVIQVYECPSPEIDSYDDESDMFGVL